MNLLPIEHKVCPHMLTDRVNITLVGCGGNGSQMLTGLARLHTALRALGRPGLNVVAWDPDGVSPANVGRQLFSPGDVGQNKATVLVHRLNSFFGIAWYAEPSRFGTRQWHARTHIVISCVDTRVAREQIRYCVEELGQHPCYWLDLGNRAADGQMVLGQPAGSKRYRQKRDRLPIVTELFPEIRNSRIKEDNTPSCSLAEALQRQELFINQLVVTQALQLLWQLLRHGKTGWHGAFINAATGRVTPLPIDREAWARFGFHHYRTLKKKGRKHESHA